MTEAFTEDLHVNLSRFVGLSVIAPYTSKFLKDKAAPETIVALGCHYLISCESLPHKRVLRMQLTRCSDWRLLQTWDQELSEWNLTEVQDELVQRIVFQLQQQIDRDLLSHSYHRISYTAQAYQLWLRGMNHLKTGTEQGDEEARKFFLKALEEDPSMARAYSGISLTYANDWSCRLWDRWDVSKNGAKTYAMKALELDSNDYISLTIMGRVCLYSEEFERGEVFLRKALLMNPGDADNLIQIAFAFVFLGHLKEALTLYEKACKLNPMRKDDYDIYGATIYFEIGDMKQCLLLGQRVDLERAWVDFPVYLAAASWYVKDLNQTQNFWRKYISLFQRHIYEGTADIAQEAFAWHIRINPYANSTKLKPFWEYLRDEILEEVTTPFGFKESNSIKYGIIRKGDVWEWYFEGRRSIVPHMKGILDLVCLITEPGKAVDCETLLGSKIHKETAIPASDSKALASYRKRLIFLRDAIETAREEESFEELQRLEDEYDFLIRELGYSQGLGGRIRKVKAVSEKSRTAVTLRIRHAIKKLDEQDHHLGKHLKESVKTGICCSYSPTIAPSWEIEIASNDTRLTS